ncbi:hypothetical protein E2C01_082550 [Portunus trituberculatus]|uniref:Uncharacterized protein n=1 Tax=Portunus trituberculatus TaxID=210409 RepID=A0A5B7J435_PORTR|nr:hypothetical protein [Portunus trituberculatus]
MGSGTGSQQTFPGEGARQHRTLSLVLVFVEGHEYLAAISVEVRGPRSLRGRSGACVCSVLVRFPGLPLIRPSRLLKNQEKSRVVHHHRKPSCAWVKPQ